MKEEKAARMESGFGRRQQVRARFDSWVEIAVSGASGMRLRGSGRDLCADGIGLCVDDFAPPKATRVMSEFLLPGITLPIAIPGVVAWVDEERARLGVRFVGVDPGLAELLSSYVEGRL